jgi:hypothetical protein
MIVSVAVRQTHDANANFVGDFDWDFDAAKVEPHNAANSVVLVIIVPNLISISPWREL